jgi:hypothetical protein
MPNRIVKGSKTSFIRAGWTDPLRIDAWSQGGYFLRVAQDSLDFYLSLHQHLMGLGTTENVPWSYMQVEIDHHVDELDLICSSQDSRIQAILGLYAYLRDGVSSNWHSSSLQYKRNLDTMALCGTESPGRGDLMPLSCRKCQSTLHSGGGVPTVQHENRVQMYLLIGAEGSVLRNRHLQMLKRKTPLHRRRSHPGLVMTSMVH